MIASFKVLKLFGFPKIPKNHLWLQLKHINRERLQLNGFYMSGILATIEAIFRWLTPLLKQNSTTIAFQ